MVHLPPESEDRERNTVPPLNFDEFVALIVAFLAIGGILLWGLTRGGGWQGLPLVGAAPVLESPEPSPPVLEEQEPTSLPEDRSRLDSRVVAPDPSAGVVVVPPSAVDPEGAASNRGPAEPRPDPAPEEAVSNTVPVAPEAEVPQVNIVDVPPNYWAYPFIAGLYSSGVIANFPEGQFKPDQPMTRAEFAALLKATLATTPGQATRSFTDIAPEYWAKDAVDQVVAAGYMQGYPEGDFRPDQLVPREQVLVTLASAPGLQGTAQSPNALSRFTDGGTVSSWARGKVAAASAAGLVANYPDPTVLRPTEPATRAEVVAMMYQVLARQARVQPIDSPYVVPEL